MNEAVIESKVFYVFFHFFLILFVYYFSKGIVEVVRKDKEKKATTVEKAILYLSCIAAVCGIAFLYGNDEDKNGDYYFNTTNAAICFIVLILPSVLGFYEGIKKDKKLTKNQRIDISSQIKRGRSDYQM